MNLVKAPLSDSGLVPSNKILGVDAVLERLLSILSKPMSLADLKLFYEKHSLFQAGDLIEWQKDSVIGKASGKVVGLGSHGELIVECEGKSVSLFTEDVRAVRLF